MGDETLLVALLGGLHLLGFGFAAVLLLPLMRDERIVPVARREDEDDAGGGNDRVRPEPRPGPRGGGLPLPDAVPARVRLREPARLADLLPAPQRRQREHTPRPVRTPARSR